MKNIIIITPFALSVLILFFYYYVGTKEKHTRFLPLLLASFAIESLYSIVQAMQQPALLQLDLKTTPLLLYGLVFIFLFMYDALSEKLASKKLIKLSLILPVLWTLMFVLEQSGWWVTQNIKDFLLTARYITGFLIIFPFVYILRPHFTKRKQIKTEVSILLITQVFALAVVLALALVFNLIIDDLYDTSFYFIKLIEISVLITFYGYIFQLYKRRLQEMKDKRLVILRPISEKLKSKTLMNHTTNNEVKRRHDLKDVSRKEQEQTHYKNSALDKKTLAQYAQKIEDYFNKNDTVYLNFDFNIDFLSSETDINKSYLSQVFNREIGKTLNQFINEKRIQYACDILRDRKEISILELAQACGYKSRTTFYQHFKNYTNLTVRQYLEQNKS